MRLGNILVGLTLLFASCVSTQPLKAQIGSVKTEEYTAGFEKKKSLDSLPPYTDTIQIPIQIFRNSISLANEETSLYRTRPRGLFCLNSQQMYL